MHGRRSTILVLIVWLLACPSMARAERAVLANDAEVRQGPGETRKAILKAKAGETVEVLGRQGRWVRILVKKRRGWILRTSLRSKALRTSRAPKWGKRGLTSARIPEGEHAVDIGDRLKAVARVDTALHPEPSTRSPAQGKVETGEELAILRARTGDRWFRVRNARGVEGWVPRTAFGNTPMATSEATATADLVATSDDEPTTPLGPLPGLEVNMAAGVGYRSLSMDFTSSGVSPLANYLARSQAATAAGRVDLVVRALEGRLHAGLDAGFRGTYSSPGFTYIHSDASARNIPYRVAETQAGLRLGGEIFSGVEAALRGGGRYDAFLTRKVDNPGLLPREVLKAATAGLRVDVRTAASALRIHLHADALVYGKRAQTPGLRDGMRARTRGFLAGASLRYPLAHGLWVSGSYEYASLDTEFSGTAERARDAMDGHRRDTSQIVELGLLRPF